MLIDVRNAFHASVAGDVSAREAPTLQDGRDVPDGTSIGFVEQLEKDLAELQAAGVDAKIASGGGRMSVTMDRYEVGTRPACAMHACPT